MPRFGEISMVVVGLFPKKKREKKREKRKEGKKEGREGGRGIIRNMFSEFGTEKSSKIDPRYADFDASLCQFCRPQTSFRGFF